MKKILTLTCYLMCLMSISNFAFAMTPYWSAREALGGLSYSGNKIYSGGFIDTTTISYAGDTKSNSTSGISSWDSDLTNPTILDNNRWDAIYGISLDSTGTGFVVTKDGHLDYVQNGKFIRTTWTFEDSPYGGVSYTGNAVYVGTSGNELKKCTADGTSCRTIDTFGSEVYGVSFDNTGTGFVVTEDGHLDLYKNDKFVKKVHTFNQYPMSVSYTGNAVYVSTEHDNILHKCSTDGTDNCVAIYKFGGLPAAISFDSNGNGYVATYAYTGGILQDEYKLRINRFANDNYIDHKLITNKNRG